MSSYSKGLLPNTPSKIAHRYGAHIHGKIRDALAAGPGTGIVLDVYEQVPDQGGTSKCHAHSLAGALWCAFNAAGKPLAFFPSPELIAATTYADLRSAQHLIPPLPQLQDTGAELQDDANAVAGWGIGPIRAPTSDGRFSDCENTPADGTSPEPDTSQLQIAGSDLISGEYAIPVDPDAPRVIVASLDSRIPVWEGGPVNSQWDNLGPNDVAQASAATDGDGHAQFIRGYRINAAGKFEFLYHGSWGKNWALNGGVWVSQDFVMTRWSLWPTAVVL